jgi:crotonobetainyl-CoA:carnitine CoA-transferase CaiB-like acyl-CoA transferase
VRDADVIVENFRPGAMNKLGLGYEEVSKVNPRIIYCSISMYGQTGPLAHRRGGEPWAQAIDGMVMNIGNPNGPSQMVTSPVTDYSTGLMSAFSIASALYARQKNGEGQRITTSLFEVGTFIQESSYMEFLIDGKLHRKVGRGHIGQFPFGSYKAKDGDVVTIFGQDDDEWNIVCSILGIEHILQDKRYDSHAKRAERRFELYPILDEAFSKRTRAEWEQAFRERGLRCDGCLDYAEVVSHPQFEANEMIIQVEHPREGSMRTLRTPIRFSKEKMSENMRHPPILGEHTEEILAELGYNSEVVKGLIEEGAVGVPTIDMLQRKQRATHVVGKMKISERAKALRKKGK